jgi:hypothetical protein
VLAKEFAEFYQGMVAKAVDLYQRIEACDRESDRINLNAPDNELRRLRGVELVARNLDAFSRSQPSIVKTCVLPEWENSSENAWPPKPALWPPTSSRRSHHTVARSGGRTPPPATRPGARRLRGSRLSTMSNIAAAKNAKI